MALNSFSLKRGDTLSRAGFLPVGALPPGAWKAKCQIVHRITGFARSINATLTPPTDEQPRWMLHLYAPSLATEQWPVGKYLGDVEFIDESALPAPFVVSSKDFVLTLNPDRTTS